VVERHGGEVFSTAGDSFAVAFPTSDGAVAAAVDAQRRLGEELSDGFRVRMAVHSGEVEEREGGFFGPVLNRCARVRDTAHGGQILATGAVHDQVDPDLVSDVVLVDLGEHRLRDLSAPERVFQVAAPGLPTEFPPIRSLGAFVHNLPTQLTSFFGRSEELTLVDKLLADTRHATLVGTGGSGKTRLALQAAAETLHLFDDGAWFVDLRDLEDPDQVGSLIASTLRVVLAGDRPVADQVVDALWARELLLILDNCEHVLEAVAPLVEQLLSRRGTVRVLTTSREPLGLPGESTIPVGPLPLPAEPDLHQLQDHEAAQLFAERARQARPGFVLDQHIEAVFEICRAVDGLPLALELAAARLRAVSPEEVAARLDDQLSMLRTTVRAGDLRHATIEATIAWSWDHLTSDEQTLFARLSVFRGTCSLKAAETICGFDPIDPAQVLDLLTSLIDKSLAVPAPSPDGPTRYRLLEPLRQYAARQLNNQHTQTLQHRAVDHWSSQFADCVTTLPIFGHEFRESDDRAETLEPDQANLTAAVEWALRSDRFEDAMVIVAGPLGVLLDKLGGYFETVSRWMDIAVTHRHIIAPDVLEAALCSAASIAGGAWENEARARYSLLGMELARNTEIREVFQIAAATALSRLGQRQRAFAMLDQIIAESANPGIQAGVLLSKAAEGFPQQAWECCRQAIDLSTIDAVGGLNELSATWVVGHCAKDVGRYDLAFEMLQRALNLAQDSVACVGVAAHLADIHIARGHLDEAATIIDEVLATARRSFGSDRSAHMIERGLIRAAKIARLQGRYDEASGLVDEWRRVGQSHLELLRIEHEALIARDRGDSEHARELLDGAYRQAKADDGTYAWLDLRDLSGCQASVDLRTGRPDRASEMLGYVLAKADSLRHVTAVDTVDLAGIAFAQLGKAAPAAHLIGAIDRQREETGLVIQPPGQHLREEAVQMTRAALGDRWEAAYRQGMEMSLDEAVEYARRLIGEAVSDSPHPDAS